MAIGVVIAIPAFAVVVCDLAYYQSNRSEIARVIAGASDAERNIPMPLADFLRQDFKNGTEAYAARLLINHLYIGQEDRIRRHWMFMYALWCELVDLHLTPEERLTVIAVLAPTGAHRVGLADTSHAIFHKQLSELDPRECATLIALIQSPSLAEHPGLLERRTAWVLGRFEREHLSREAPTTLATK